MAVNLTLENEHYDSVCVPITLEERSATEKKAIDIGKAKRAFCKAKECVPYEECPRANGGCFAMQRFIKALEE